MEGDSKTVRLVVQLQTLYRARRARRQVAELVKSAYVEYWDPVNGLAYYYNVHTGISSWEKPMLLAAQDSTNFELQAPLKTLNNSVKSCVNSLLQLRLEDQEKQREECSTFKKLCDDEKQALMRRHRRKIARATHRFNTKILDDMKNARQERQAKLKNENIQLLQDLSEGRTKENVQSIREASMQGNLERVKMLLNMGLSANAESAMGLTPLLAACQGNHASVVRLLLLSGACVNHAHVKTGRTALMEAASRADAAVLRELLRFGANIDFKDMRGETVFDYLKDTANRNLIESACQPWSIENALFPTEFRKISFTCALVRKRQWAMYKRERATTRMELSELKQTIQRKLIDAKVRYDQDIRNSRFEPTLLRRLKTIEKADAHYDAERRTLLMATQDAVDRRREKERPWYLSDVAMQNILSFCSRHWFLQKSKRILSLNKKSEKSRNGTSVAPKKLRPPPDQIPDALDVEWISFERFFQESCNELQALAGSEFFDAINNISRDANGNSLATLDICVQQGNNLPYRDPIFKDMINPYVRVFLRSATIVERTEVYQSDTHIADCNPVWMYRCQIKSVPSIHRELGIQIVDAKRGEVAGEIFIPLRKFLDQKDQNEWYVVPPTLRQQILEKKPRDQPARIQVLVRFTHTKSMVLTRELQKLSQTRESLVQKRRDIIQRALDLRLDKLP
ncbi:putative C2 domain, WW domain, ankyrin repeat-containing domain, C2 domain superfamily [Plasmopara halstedii]